MTLILVVSVALVLVVTVGGWSRLQGMIPVSLVWSAVYLVIAFFIERRWARGLLPLAAALAILLLAISLIAGLGAVGTSWFDRSQSGYAPADSLFGGHGLSADTLGLLTLMIAPVQLVLILVATRGFAQNWNIEVEAPAAPAAPRG